MIKCQKQKSFCILKDLTDRNSHRKCSVKKGVLRNFAKFTGKHLCQSLSYSLCNFIKKETLAQVFSCEFCEIFKNNFFKRTPPVAASVGVSSLKEVGQNLRPLLSTIMEKNICWLFHIFAQFPFTTSEKEPHYYHERWMCELPYELPNDLRLKILRNRNFEEKS